MTNQVIRLPPINNGRSGIELRGSYPPVIEVYRTGKIVDFSARAAVKIQAARNPILTAGIVIGSCVEEVNVSHSTKPLHRLSTHFLLANAYRFLLGETMAVLAIVGSIPAIATVLIVAVIYAIAVRIVVAINRAIAGYRSLIISARIPQDVEGIAFRAVVSILNLHHGYSAILRIADESLPPAAINPLKSEVRGVWRHWGVAFKTPPLRRLSG